MKNSNERFRRIVEIDVLPGVRKPGRYAGGEWNAVRKDWDSAAVRMALCFPEVYEIGMSNLGFLLLYHLINGLDGVLCERAFAPWPDMERALAARGLPLYSLESFHPLAEFDVIGFSLSYEMTYTNVLTMLGLAGLPFRSADRPAAWPLVIAGGGSAVNPEPVADFFDAVVVGEGEEVVAEILARAASAKEGGVDKKQLLESLSKIEGVYVPSLYRVSETENGLLAVDEEPRPVRRRYIKELDDSPMPDGFVVPWVEAVHDRIQLELFRGCTQGCRFCQAGMIYRPRRERSAAALLAAARSLYPRMGCDEFSLLSLNAPDYSQMGPLLDGLTAAATPNRVSVSMPSTRADTFSGEVAAKMRQVRSTGLTLAPEAGTQRLRDSINKRITDDEIARAVEAALDAGWKKIKLYFMIGLPGETMEDVRGIASLVDRLTDVARLAKGGGRKTDFTLSVSNFVPKPHTPFQWAPMDTMENLREKQRTLRGLIDTRRVKFDRHDVETSFLEAVFSRGDRRLSRAIEEAWRLGRRFDGWTDQFDFSEWLAAFGKAGLKPEDYANRALRPMSRLPWSHIDIGVAEKFLLLESNKAERGATTGDCGGVRCAGCGIDCEKQD